MKYILILFCVFIQSVLLFAQEPLATFETNHDSRMGALGFVARFATHGESLYSYKPVNYFDDPAAKIWTIQGTLKHSFAGAILYDQAADGLWHATYEETLAQKYIVKLWSTSLDKPFKELSLDQRIKYLKFSPKGEYLFIGDDYDNIQIWRVNKGKLEKSLKIENPVQIHNTYTRQFPLFFHPDGDKILIGDAKGGLNWLNFMSDAQIPCIPSNPVLRINSGYHIQLDSEKKQIAIVYDDYDNNTGKSTYFLRIWDLSGVLVREKKLETQDIREMSVLTSDFKHLLTVNKSQNQVFITDTETGKTLGAFNPHPKYEKYSQEISPKIANIDISPNGKYLLSIADDTQIKLWELSKILEIRERPSTGSVNTPSNQNTHPSTTQNLDIDLDFDIDKIKNEGNYYALIIAVQNYQDEGIRDLANPLQDAGALSEVLQSSYLFKPENTITLQDPTRGEIIQTFDDLSRKLNPLDNLLIFYAGHGYWDEKLAQGYWFPSDAQKNYRSNWLSNADLATYIGGIKTKHTLLITDACFSGSIVTRSAFENAPSSIRNLYRLNSRKAMTSGSLQEVPDVSVFTKYLIKALQENTEQYISAGQIYNYLQVPVLSNTNTNPQHSVIQNTGHEGGDFIFIRK
ncbi:MAG: caspase family protein [Microscillaceae bacterium]|nr:caspase family protein [Microscillaceae bacterium]